MKKKLLMALTLLLAGGSLFADDAAKLDQYKKLAKEGNPEAAFYVGLMTQDGVGTKVDPSEAAKWYEKSANAGYGHAKTNLGILYWKGKGVEVSKEKACGLWKDSGTVTGEHLYTIRCK